MLTACNDPAIKDAIPPQCVEIPGEACPPPSSETGGDETGGTGEEDTGSEGRTPLGPGECVLNENQNRIGLQYNCFGELHTSMDLAITDLLPTCEDVFDDDGWCHDDFYFDYQPNVVACCGEYDIEFKPEFQLYCSFDLFEQVCFSLAHRLEYLIQQGLFKSYTDKAIELHNFVATHQTECFNSFRDNSVAVLPNVQTHWAIPQSFGLLSDIVFHIDADTRIDGVNGPPNDSEWPTCIGAGYNDDTLFGTDQGSTGGIVVGVDLASPVHAELSGPVVLGGAVSAAADLGTACTPRGCPAAAFSYAKRGPAFGLDALALYGDAFEVSNGEYVLTADRVQIQLYAPAKGTQVLDPDGAIGYEIPAGAASFLVAGAAGDITNRFMAANTTSIFIFPSLDTWEVDAFLIEYEDGNDQRWTLIVEESIWR